MSDCGLAVTFRHLYLGFLSCPTLLMKTHESREQGRWGLRPSQTSKVNMLKRQMTSIRIGFRGVPYTGGKSGLGGVSESPYCCLFCIILFTTFGITPWTIYASKVYTCLLPPSHRWAELFWRALIRIYHIYLYWVSLFKEYFVVVDISD